MNTESAGWVVFGVVLDSMVLLSVTGLAGIPGGDFDE